MFSKSVLRLLLASIIFLSACSTNTITKQVNESNDNDLMVQSVQQPKILVASDHKGFFVDKNNNVWGWGDIYHEVYLGPSLGYAYSPTQLPNLNNVESITTHHFHAHVLKNDGTVWGWGLQDDMQLGDGTSTSLMGNSTTNPVQAVGLSNVKDVSAGWFSSLAVKTDGTVWQWGTLDWGAGCCNPASPVPIQRPNITGVEAVAATQLAALALKADGTVWQLDPDREYDNVFQWPAPYQIPNLSNIIAISVGQRGYGYGNSDPKEHYSALRADGTVWSWGDNSLGQLGDGVTVDRSTPVQATGLSDVKAIYASPRHTLALKNDGTLWGWGDNSAGQLGIGGTQNQYLIPVQIPNIRNVATMAAGATYSLALLEDCTLWSWGTGDIGQLADGNSSTHTVTVPQRVATLPCNATNTDFDGDGISNTTEYQTSCLDVFTPDAHLDFDNDGLLNEDELALGTDPCNPDTDSDNVNDGSDNCPNSANTNQVDFDGDRIGNVCDNDADGDGCNKPFDPNDFDPNVGCSVISVTYAFNREGNLINLDPRLADPRNRGFIEGKIPDHDPLCEQVDCPPPLTLLNIFDEDFNESLLTISADAYGFSEEDGFGYSSHILPDIDGDGIGDIAIGTHLANDRAGVLTIISGSTGEEINRLEGNFPDEMLGSRLVLLNENTLAVGALGGNSIYIVNSNLEVENSFSGEVEDGFGLALVALEDLDGDGLAELAIGAPYAEDNKGRVYIAYSSGDLQILANGNNQGEQFGYALAAADVDSDGLADLLIGAPEANEGKGEIRAINLTGEELWSQQGEEGEQFGFSLASYTNEETVQILVGAPGWQENAGRAYLLESDGNVSGHTSTNQEGAQLGSNVAMTLGSQGTAYLVAFASSSDQSYFYDITEGNF